MESNNLSIVLPPALSAKFKTSFAYSSIKDRLPKILASVADALYRQKTKILEEYGELAVEDLKVITGKISKLRYEISTDKRLVELCDSYSDVDEWNQYFKEQVKVSGSVPTWFSSPWFYVESYCYRKIHEAVFMSSHLQSLDVFEKFKRDAYFASDQQITTVLTHLMLTMDECTSESELFAFYHKYVQVSLWANKSDLSFSAGKQSAQNECILKTLKHLVSNIIIDETRHSWDILQKTVATRGAPGRIDIVADNAGFELVTDLVLAEFFLNTKLASSIHIHLKPISWFVSDATSNDLQWILHTMCGTNNLAISRFGAKMKSNLDNGDLVVHQHSFWTSPFPMFEMKLKAPGLYEELETSDLIIFKGDLNFRKLVGDLSWDPATPFQTSLRGFHPAPLLSIRTLKADVVTGIDPEIGRKLTATDDHWMTIGKYGTLLFNNGQTV